MSRIGQVPGWWHTLPAMRRADLLDLLAAVDRAGVARNDRTAVEAIWTARRVARARLRLVQEMVERERLERDHAA
jgi:hypothetical protein